MRKCADDDAVAPPSRDGVVYSELVLTSLHQAKQRIQSIIVLLLSSVATGDGGVYLRPQLGGGVAAWTQPHVHVGRQGRL
jgi:hypothetical protein